MITKITSFTVHYTAEGTRISYVYSQIDGGGNLVKSNQRASIFVLDEGISANIKSLENWLIAKVEGQK